MYKLVFTKPAGKFLEGLTDLIAERIAFKVNALKENPRPQGIKKISGAQNLYRIRIGEYRVIYSIYENILTVEVIRIGHRKDVYR